MNFSTKKYQQQYQKEYRLKNKEQMKEYQKKYKENNKEVLIKYKKKWYKKYHEINLRKKKEYRKKNRSILLDKAQKYYKQNRNIILIKFKKYQKNNPEIILKGQIKHLKKLGKELKLPYKKYEWALHSWNKTIRKLLGGKCLVCGSTFKVNIHHLFHKAKYPKLSLNINNGIPLCKIHHREAHGYFQEIK